MTKRCYPFDSCLTIPLQRKLHISCKEVDMGIASDWRMPLVYDKTLSRLFNGVRHNKTSTAVVDIVPSVTSNNALEVGNSARNGKPHSHRQMLLNSAGQLQRSVLRSEPVPLAAIPSSAQEGSCTSCAKQVPVLMFASPRCHFCERSVCCSCRQTCHRCGNEFCALCSLKIYDHKDEETVCLSCR